MDCEIYCMLDTGQQEETKPVCVHPWPYHVGGDINFHQSSAARGTNWERSEFVVAEEEDTQFTHLLKNNTTTTTTTTKTKTKTSIMPIMQLCPT